MNVPQTSLPNTWQLLTDKERRLIASLADAPKTIRHSHLFMVMKATRLCNLRCTYCNSWKDGPNQIMQPEILSKATCEAMRLPWVEQIDFIWHGGETTLLPISFFEHALELQRQIASPRTVTNAIQTNGTLLTEEWITLFERFNFTVGVSLDPPPERHARTRTTKSGRDSWQESMRGLRLLRAHGIEHGVLIVVSPELVNKGAAQFLTCLDEHDLTKVALLNVLPSNANPVEGGEDYLDWNAYVDFLIETYLLWRKAYKGRLHIRDLDSLTGNIRGRRPTSCVFAGNCMGQFLTIEPNGEVSACDKFIGDGSHVFGHLGRQTLEDILGSSALAETQRRYFDAQLNLEKCKYYRYCNGGCPHDQYLRRKLHPEIHIGCCGLSRLIDTIKKEEEVTC